MGDRSTVIRGNQIRNLSITGDDIESGTLTFEELAVANSPFDGAVLSMSGDGESGSYLEWQPGSYWDRDSSGVISPVTPGDSLSLEDLSISGDLTMTGASSWLRFPMMTTAEETAMIAAWGVGEQGRTWYNTTEDQLSVWNGDIPFYVGGGPGLKYTISVDGSRTDAYTEDGSHEKPFKTLKAALVYLRDTASPTPDSTHRYNVKVSSGFYTEDNPMPVVPYVYTSGDFKHNPRILPANNDEHLFEFPAGYTTCDFGELTFQAPTGNAIDGVKAIFYAGTGALPICGIYFCLLIGTDATYSEAIHNTEPVSGFHLVSCFAYGSYNNFMHIENGNYADDGMIIHDGTVMTNYVNMTGAGNIEMSEVECNSDLVVNMYNVNHAEASVRATDVVFSGTNALVTGPLGGTISLTACDMKGANIIDGGDISIYASTFTGDAYITALTGNCTAMKLFNCQNINSVRSCVEMTGNNSIFYSAGNYFISPSSIDAIVLDGTYSTADVEGTKQFTQSSLANGANVTKIHYPDTSNTRLVQVSGYSVGGTGAIEYLTANEANYAQEDNTKTAFASNQVILEGIGLIPYAWWHLNETTGTVATDASSNGRHGALTNMENADWVAGKLNNCLVFDGTNEYVDLGGIAKFASVATFSVECWFKTTDDTCGIITCKTQGGTGRGWYLGLNASGQIDVILANNDTGSYIQVRTTTTYNDDTWYHMVMTYDGSSTAAGVIIYIDTATPALTTLSDTLTGSIASSTNAQMAGNDGINNMYAGYIDEAVIYDVVVSPTEIAVRYNGGTGTETMPGNYDTTEGWYVTTLDASQLDTSLWPNIVSVLIDDAAPTNTETKYLLSVDGRTTWYYWNSGTATWLASSLDSSGGDDIDTNGNTSSDLMTLTSDNWADLFVAGTLDVAVSLKTTSNLITPSVNSVEFAYSAGSRLLFDGSDVQIEFLSSTQTKFTNNSGGALYDLRMNIFKRETY